MKRLSYLIFLLPLLASGQQPIWEWDHEPDDSSRYNIGLDAIVSVGSDGVHFGDILNFMTDDYLDQDEKDAFTSSMSARNRYGGHNRLSFYFLCRPEGQRALERSAVRGWSLDYTQLDGLSFSDSLALMALYGNAPYAGADVHTGPLSLIRLSYSEIAFHYSENTSSGGRWSISPSFILGHQLQDLRLDESSVYTHADGDFLRVVYDGRAHSSAPGAGSGLAVNGLGFGVDLAYEMSFGQRHYFKAGIQDLGIIFWGDRSVQWSVTDTLNFEGLDIPNLLDISDTLFSNEMDSIREAHFEGEKGAFSRLIPSLVLLQYKHRLDKGSWKSIDLLINQRLNGIQKPQLALGACFEFPAKRLPGGSQQKFRPYVLYGGYNGFGMGIQYRLSLSSGWSIGMDLSNAQSVVIPNNSYGLGLRFNLNYSFR